MIQTVFIYNQVYGRATDTAQHKATGQDHGMPLNAQEFCLPQPLPVWKAELSQHPTVSTCKILGNKICSVLIFE